jgi:hypothetical protein
MFKVLINYLLSQQNLRMSEAVKACSPKLQGKAVISGVDTPGKFLEPGKEFHPTFDLVVCLMII